MSEHEQERVEDLDLPESESDQVKGGAIYVKHSGGANTSIEGIKTDPNTTPSFDIKSQKVIGGPH